MANYADKFYALNALKNRVAVVIEQLQDQSEESLPPVHYASLFEDARDLQDDINFVMRNDNLKTWVNEAEITLLDMRVKNLENDLVAKLT